MPMLIIVEGCYNFGELYDEEGGRTKR